MIELNNLLSVKWYRGGKHKDSEGDLWDSYIPDNRLVEICTLLLEALKYDHEMALMGIASHRDCIVGNVQTALARAEAYAARVPEGE